MECVHSVHSSLKNADVARTGTCIRILYLQGIGAHLVEHGYNEFTLFDRGPAVNGIYQERIQKKVVVVVVVAIIKWTPMYSELSSATRLCRANS